MHVLRKTTKNFSQDTSSEVRKRVSRDVYCFVLHCRKVVGIRVSEHLRHVGNCDIRAEVVQCREDSVGPQNVVPGFRRK